MEQIKSYYNAFRRARRDLCLPPVKGLDKNKICEILLSTGDTDAKQFVEKMQRRHADYVPHSSETLYPLEWWNYKYQGERLFCNNNRIFVFIAYRNKFVDGRELKGKTSDIGRKISELLDNVTMEDVHVIRYHYDKEASLTGDYTALALSTIYSE